MKKPATSFYKTILAVNTGEREAVELGLVVDGAIKAQEKFPVRSQELQVCIANFLAAHNITIPQLKALAVFRSGESLTGSRMGVAAVNTLAWLANIPIIEIDEIGFEAGLKSLTRDELSLSVVKQTLPLS